MKHCVTPVALALAACLAAAASHPARAAIETDDPQASLQLPAGGAAAVVTAGDFSLLLWLRPDELPANQASAGLPAQASILHLDHALNLSLRSDGSFSATLFDNSSATLTAATSPVLMPNRSAGQIQQWVLVGISFDADAGSLSIWAHPETQPLTSATANQAGFTVANPGSALRIGATENLPAALGMYGLIALRNHTIAEADIIDLWNHRRHHGPYSHDNTAAGGSLTGPEGCRWMINHAMTTAPIDLGAGGQPHQRAAVVDEPLTRYNLHVYDASGPQGTSLRAVRAVIATDGFIHRSPYETSPAGAADSSERFFIRTLPEVSDTFPDPPHYVARISPMARLLATELPQGIGLVRVIASANSRGIMAGDGSATGTANFAHGFLWNNIHRTAGVLNRPARLDAGPWFGFDAAANAPHTAGSVAELKTTDFSRFWTSADSTSSIGPGDGVRLLPGASYTLRCKPQGLITADHPLLVQAHLLRFPGASNVQWVPNRHHRQGQSGTSVGQVKAVTLDTETWSHMLNTAAGDQIISPTQIALLGDHQSQLAVGDACFAGNASISVIAAISYDGTRTILEFEHPFLTAPADGAILRFGPWGYAAVWHHWNPLTPDDPANWRGLKLTAGPGEGVVLFSFDAWRPGVDGFVFGVAGWGGMGYEQHIKRSFADVTTAWASQLQADIWLQMFATQLSHPSYMDIYTEQIRAASPHVEVVWLGDIEHPSTWDHELWHWWALTQASDNQVVASTLLRHEQLGSQLDLFGDGIRSDTLHATQRGNQRMAELWTEELLHAALPGPLPKTGDLNADDTVDVSDLLTLLSAWGPCSNLNTCVGDLTGEGAVDVSDLLLLLSNWG